MIFSDNKYPQHLVYNMIIIWVNTQKDRVAQKLMDLGYSIGVLKIMQRQLVGFQFFLFGSNE